MVRMRIFLDTFKIRKRSFINAFSICMTVPLMCVDIYRHLMLDICQVNWTIDCNLRVFEFFLTRCKKCLSRLSILYLVLEILNVVPGYFEVNSMNYNQFKKASQKIVCFGYVKTSISSKLIYSLHEVFSWWFSLVPNFLFFLMKLVYFAFSMFLFIFIFITYSYYHKCA